MQSVGSSTTGHVAVLAYHSVGTGCAAAFARWQVPPSLLDEQLAALTGAGYRLRAVSPTGADPEGPTVALTFDDGFADFLSAAPLVDRHADSATLYVPSGMIGARAAWLAREGEAGRRLLTWQELSALSGSLEVGSHSRTHAALDLLDPRTLDEEVAGSRQELEQRLGVACRSFAYPFGFHHAGVRAAVRRAGYDSACEVGYRRPGVRASRFAVSRLLVTPDISPELLVRLVSGRAVQWRRSTRWLRPAHRWLRRRRSGLVPR